MNAGLILLKLKKCAGWVIYMAVVLGIITAAACVSAIYARSVKQTYNASIAENYKYGIFFSAYINAETLFNNNDLFDKGSVLSITGANASVNGQSVGAGKAVLGQSAGLLRLALNQDVGEGVEASGEGIFLSECTAETLQVKKGDSVVASGFTRENTVFTVKGIYESDFDSAGFVVCIGSADSLRPGESVSALVVRDEMRELYLAKKILERENVQISDDEAVTLFARVRSAEAALWTAAAVILCAGVGIFFKSAGGQRDRNRRLNEICFRSGLSGKSALINEAVFLYVTLFAGVMLSAAVSAICVTALNEALGRYFVIRVDFKFAALTLFAATAVYLSVATISAAGSFNKKLRRNNYEQNGESYG